MNDIAKLVPGRGEAEIAEDLKARTKEALKVVAGIMDEAATHGLSIGWDGIAPMAPFFKHEPLNVRVIKNY